MQLADFEEVTEVVRVKTATTSRYNYDFHVTDGTYTFLPSYQSKSVSESENDLYHTVSSGEVGKLDLISYKYYKTTDLWWVIAQANGVINPLRVEPGTRLRIPSIELVFREVV